jgi:uncharacterized MnhB-related membrane protein
MMPSLLAVPDVSVTPIAAVGAGLTVIVVEKYVWQPLFEMVTE